jgi:hypothetical protein
VIRNKPEHLVLSCSHGHTARALLDDYWWDIFRDNFHGDLYTTTSVCNGRQTEEPTTLTLQGPQGPCSPMATQPTAIPSCHHPSKVSRAVDKAISDSTRLDLYL